MAFERGKRQYKILMWTIMIYRIATISAVKDQGKKEGIGIRGLNYKTGTAPILDTSDCGNDNVSARGHWQHHT